ncbi:HAD family phosphatase [Synechococcus sp. R8-2]|uniref:HAD family hydrolase n=1 Tax=Synechococcus sp. R8-2 TaxID=2291959 RepID=UPI0039C1DEB6
MGLQGVILSWSGVVADDENLHLQAINQLLVEENLRPWNLCWPKSGSPGQRELYRLQYLGRPDRERLPALWGDQGRVLSPKQLEELLKRKALYYRQALQGQRELPLIPGLAETLETLERLQLKVGLLCGQSAAEVAAFLERFQPCCPALTRLTDGGSYRVTGDDAGPMLSPGHLHRLLLQRMELPAQACLSIEATYSGIQAARSAGIPVLALATFFPLHMLQRRANWAVDGYHQVEWDRIQNWFAGGQDRPSTPVEAEAEAGSFKGSQGEQPQP